jgi:hypothetical protein
MSSFFRSANDVTDSRTSTSPEESATGAYEDDEPGLSSSQVIFKTSTHDSTISIGEDNQPATLSLINNPNQDHSHYVLHALLEEKCVNEALSYFQEHSRGNELFTKDHPDVKALAELKYNYMSKLRSFSSFNNFSY